MADGTPMKPVTSSTATILLQIGSHQEKIRFYVAEIPHDLLLGLPWLRLHSPAINWKDNTLTFTKTCIDANHCLAPCMVNTLRPIPRQLSLTRPRSQRSTTNVIHCMSIMDAQPFLDLARTEGLDIHQCFYRLNERVISVNSIQTEKIYAESATPLDAGGVPLKYSDFEDVFHNKSDPPLSLPPHREHDLSIELDEGKPLPPPGKIYPLDPEQSDALQEYLEKALVNGWISPSSSPIAAPCFFVKKPNGGLRLCVDYRAINEITKKNRYPLPLISEVLDELLAAKIFTRLDLPDAYHLLRIRAGDEWKTAFRCKFGEYEYNVVPFGLCNAPANFQAFMNETFKDFKYRFVVLYLDDILIYSKDPKEHDSNVRKVLQRLREHNLYVNPVKCSFDVKIIDFLGYIVSPEGLSMDPAKTHIIRDWREPRKVKDVQSFLGFANYYRRFIADFSKITKPLTSLLQKSTEFIWNEDANAAFQTLKAAFASAPILIFFDYSKPAFLETDASDFAISAILSQNDDKKVLHPVAFHSRTLLAAEINYDTHDKELLAIVDALKTFRHYVISASPEKPLQIFSDHRNLLSFMKLQTLSRRQYRWREALSEFNFVIIHRPGRLNLKADVLSRLSQHEDEVKDRPNPNNTAIFNLRDDKLVLEPSIDVCTIVDDPENEFLRRIREAINDSEVLQRFHEGKLPPNYSYTNGLLFYDDLVHLPTVELQIQAISDSHTSLASGHFGVNKTVELIRRNFHWDGIRRAVQRFINGCDVCSRAKADRSAPYGLLKPLPVPAGRWTDLSIDFITDLPPSGDSKYDAICVIKCHLTKQAHFISAHKSIDAPGTAKLFIANIFRLHGFPNSITSDRGPQFVSLFWNEFLQQMNCKRNLSSAFHPQSNASAEVTNQVIEQYLRIFCNYEQSNWSDLLSLAEFAHNNSLNSSTQMTPFFANQGYHPQFSSLVNTTSPSPPATSQVQEIDVTLENLQANLRHAQEAYTTFANNHRRAHNFKIGDLVFLNRKNIRTTRPSTKLDDKFFGPFKIISQINDVAFRLRLPSSMKIHPVFHVSLFKPKDPDHTAIPQSPPPDPITVSGQLEYEVEAILDSKRYRNSVRYLVHWKGYDASERTWEPISALANCNDLVLEFHERNPTKPQANEISRRNS